MKYIKLYTIIIFIMMAVLVCGCTKIEKEPEYPHWSPTPEQREMSTEELRELLEPIYEHKESIDDSEE